MHHSFLRHGALWVPVQAKFRRRDYNRSGEDEYMVNEKVAIVSFIITMQRSQPHHHWPLAVKLHHATKEGGRYRAQTLRSRSIPKMTIEEYRAIHVLNLTCAAMGLRNSSIEEANGLFMPMPELPPNCPKHAHNL